MHFYIQNKIKQSNLMITFLPLIIYHYFIIKTQINQITCFIYEVKSTRAITRTKDDKVKLLLRPVCVPDRANFDLKQSWHVELMS